MEWIFNENSWWDLRASELRTLCCHLGEALDNRPRDGRFGQFWTILEVLCVIFVNLLWVSILGQLKREIVWKFVKNWHKTKVSHRIQLEVVQKPQLASIKAICFCSIPRVSTPWQFRSSSSFQFKLVKSLKICPFTSINVV